MSLSDRTTSQASQSHCQVRQTIVPGGHGAESQHSWAIVAAKSAGPTATTSQRRCPDTMPLDLGLLRLAWYLVIRGSRLPAGARVPEFPGRERRDPVRFVRY